MWMKLTPKTNGANSDFWRASSHGPQDGPVLVEVDRRIDARGRAAKALTQAVRSQRRIQNTYESPWYKPELVDCVEATERDFAEVEASQTRMIASDE